MPTEFDGDDLRDAVFWGVDLRGAMLRDVDMRGLRTHHALIEGVTIDGFVDSLVVNDVDVSDFVRASDPWQPLRGMLRPTTADEVRAGWVETERVWADTLRSAAGLSDDARRTRVAGEWSFVETLRHLVFAFDKWFTVPLAGGGFHPIGIPNSGSADFPWPGIEPDADPTFDEVLSVRRDRSALVDEALAGLVDADLSREVEVLENGTVTVLDCWHTVLEEAFEHRRYALRDLDRLGG